MLFGFRFAILRSTFMQSLSKTTQLRFTLPSLTSFYFRVSRSLTQPSAGRTFPDSESSCLPLGPSCRGGQTSLPCPSLNFFLLCRERGRSADTLILPLHLSSRLFFVGYSDSLWNTLVSVAAGGSFLLHFLLPNLRRKFFRAFYSWRLSESFFFGVCLSCHFTLVGGFSRILTSWGARPPGYKFRPLMRTGGATVAAVASCSSSRSPAAASIGALPKARSAVARLMRRIP